MWRSVVVGVAQTPTVCSATSGPRRERLRPHIISGDVIGPIPPTIVRIRPVREVEAVDGCLKGRSQDCPDGDQQDAQSDTHAIASMSRDGFSDLLSVSDRSP